MPALHVGDTWTHKATGPNFDSTATTEVKAIEDHGGSSAYRIDGTLTTTSSGTTSTGTSKTWTRVSDGATLETQTTTHITVQGQSYDSTSTTVFDPPCEGWEWPLDVGDSWTRTCHATTTTSLGGGSTSSDTTTTTTVEARESVTVPAGTFNAYRLKVDSGGGGVSTVWYASEACGAVKTTASSQGQSVTSELQSYDC
jgi:hypothetical protein